MITCPNCRTEVEWLHSCLSCYNSFCHQCQEQWDEQSQWCSFCIDRDRNQHQREKAFTGKLRQWLTHKAVVDEPALDSPLPWRVRYDLIKERYLLVYGVGEDKVGIIADFQNKKLDADHACHAANTSYELMSALAMVYNRIRNGDTLCDFQPKDIELWKKVRELIK